MSTTRPWTVKLVIGNLAMLLVLLHVVKSVWGDPEREIANLCWAILMYLYAMDMLRENGK